MNVKKVKDVLRKHWLFRFGISEYHCLMSWIAPRLVPDEKAIKKYFKKFSGKELDLNNPVTFSEKLNWYKLNDKNPLKTKCVDKYAVREYVKEKGYEETLNEVYSIYKNAYQINIGALPDQFVLKATHGSHMNLIVKDKSKVNWVCEKIMMQSWLNQNIYWSGREWPYKNVHRRIIAEKYLEDRTGELRDYKFFCFNGIPKYIDVDVNRFSGHFRNFYDTEWKFLPMTSCVSNNPDVVLEKPECFEKMLEMAGRLSEPFQFARIDLYESKGKVFFGEITFFPDGGNPGYPKEWDEKWGNCWELIKS